MLRSVLDGLSRQLPSQCAVCHAWPARRLCDACVSRFAAPQQRCTTCALAVSADRERCGACEAQPPPLDACRAAVSYEYPWSGIVQQFKFHGQSAWARTLAQLLLAAPGVENAIESADMLIPMPLSVTRLRERGFNQSALLAQALAPAGVRHGVLLRTMDTAAQSGLDRRARMKNVQSAFAIEPASYAAMKAKHVVLVDDVMTSGASMFACAAVLRQAGAARVTGVVFARTPAYDETTQ